MKNENVITYWTITKDKVLVCNQCEYRYMCFDDSELIKINDKNYKRKYECSYNPFISKWDYEENYLTLEDCGVKIDQIKFVLIKEK